MIRYVKCPYCGFENKVYVGEDFYLPKKIITCDIDEGGCDKDFVIDVIKKIEIKTYKIEGQDDL